MLTRPRETHRELILGRPGRPGKRNNKKYAKMKEFYGGIYLTYCSSSEV